MKTYSDAIEAVLYKSVVLSPDLLSQIERLIEASPQLGYTTKEEFIQDAIRSKITSSSEEKPLQNNHRKPKNRF